CSGRAGADDCDMKLAWSHRLRLRLRAEAGVKQTAVEALGLSGRFQRYRIFCDTGRSEIVGLAADCDHQRVIINRGGPGDLAPILVEGRGKTHLLDDAIETDHFAEAIAKSVPMRLGEVVHLIFAGVEAARGHG